MTAAVPVPDESPDSIAPARVRGVVLRGTGGVWHVHCEDGETREAALRGRLKHEEAPVAIRKLAVGDEVTLEPGERGTGWLITEIHPRRSKLARRSPGSAYGERIVGANVDQIVVVFAAAQPEPHPRMLDRFLVIAAANDLPAHIVINKVDLASEPEVHARFADYARAGYPLHLASVKRGVGLEELRAALLGTAGSHRVSALSGPSGVGKSSLLNALFPGLKLRVGEISRSVNKGRHTTVGADLHPLADGAYVMDTPGLREVGVWGLEAGELDRCFLEMRPFLGECRFGDCAHRAEPGCAVREAVERGTISAARYESYLKLRAELEENTPEW
jgi:ribosome biogenesis GTPase